MTIKMNKTILLIFILIPFLSQAKGKKYADYIEYDLDNGLHVILFKDVNEPNVIVGTKYHVGAKNEVKNRTGFAHFYEHLLFHGTKNIPQGEFENIIMNAGGYCNAYTSYDVTYYYQFLPAHEYKLGLWVESERLLHPIITKEGIDRERDIVKEEKRMRYDNKPLGNAYFDMMSAFCTYETYGHNMIGSMEDLDASSVDDFDSFFKTFYVPNNACLVVAGNIDIKETKKWIGYYFDDIPRGKKIKRPKKIVKDQNHEIRIEKSIKGLKKNAIAIGYNVMPETHQDALIMKVIAAILSGDRSYSYFENEVLTQSDTIISHLKATSELWEKVGILQIKGTIKQEGKEEYLIAKVDEQLNRLKNEIIDETFLRQVINSFESAYIDYYFHSESLADAITNYYHFWGSTQEFDEIIERYNSIFPEDIQRVARKYFNKDNRAVIFYHPLKN